MRISSFISFKNKKGRKTLLNLPFRRSVSSTKLRFLHVATTRTAVLFDLKSSISLHKRDPNCETDAAVAENRSIEHSTSKSSITTFNMIYFIRNPMLSCQKYIHSKFPLFFFFILLLLYRYSIATIFVFILFLLLFFIMIDCSPMLGSDKLLDWK